ncbi:MAG TPA: class I SAM-dependent methyltransferase [Acidimicrobiia bacterium]
MPESSGRNHDEVVDIVRRGYDRIADGYLAAVRDRRDADPRDVWLDLLTDRLAPGSRVLDAGCGPGVPTAAHLVSLGYEVVGVDVSERQIALAREHVVGARFEVGDFAAYTGVAPGWLDAIVALYSLTHVPRSEYVELFGRFATWLRPGGWFLASLGRSDSAGWDEEDFLGFAGTKSFTNSFDVDDTIALLRTAGFEIVEHALVDDDTPFGHEQWLWVLSRTSL